MNASGRRVRRGLGVTLGIVLTGLIAGFVITRRPEFGSQPAGARLARIQRSPQWRDDQFVSVEPLWADSRAAWRRLVLGPRPRHTSPDWPIPALHRTASDLAAPPATGLRVTWFGHSSALVEIDGGRVLIDPFWSERASPVQWAGPRRWFPAPVALADLPAIDAVVISHDHHDHLDYAAITALKSSRALFVVPLGIGAHLEHWGIPPERIVELDWWQSTRVRGLEIVATPARHASGRLSTRSNKTLWAGFAIIGSAHRAWYSGDTGFHADLAVIGQRLGPFDVTLIEAGQYDALWPDTHLGPEQAVAAHRAVRGAVMIPVHWGLLQLAPHPWTEPAERVRVAARCHDVTVLLPRPGQSVEPTVPQDLPPWWPELPWGSAAAFAVASTAHGLPSERVATGPCRSG